MVSGDFVRFHWPYTQTQHILFFLFLLQTHTSLIHLASIICFPAVSVFSANTHRTLQMVDGTHVHARTRTQAHTSLFLAVSISLWNVESLSCTFFPLLALNFISFSNSILLFSEVFLLLLHLHSSQIRNTAVHKNLPYINRQKSDVYLEPCHDFFFFFCWDLNFLS